VASICKLSAIAAEPELLAALEAFLRERQLTFVRSETEWALVGKRETPHYGEKFPTVFSVKGMTNGVVDAYFNSFAILHDLPCFMSGKLAKPVVVNYYQSVSEANYWAYYADGALVRSIESQQEGAPLPFEPPGTEHLEEFDSDTQLEFSRKVGVPVEFWDDNPPGWTNLTLAGNAAQKPAPRPWWRFW
jgi:hypothetical protein